VRKSLLILACAAVISGCGTSNPPSAAPSKSALAKAFSGSSSKLQQLHAQANQLLGGSKSDFDARLAQLRGLPVVVNKWASWCAPCRGEFPVFQKIVLKVGNKVAFLGLDGQDNDGDANKFLRSFPVSYPSYKDPDLKIASSIQAGVAFPTTIFFSPTGKLIYAHPGPYTKESDLLADIRRYTR
jgi:cytochrome c biogenesis protein CcmG/thiol:disulfide interchange protein DsbE